MSGLFYNAFTFYCAPGYINTWDTSNVTDTSYMSYYACAFNSDISGWNMSKVTNIQGMFFNAHSFNGDI
jgi:hypothetical protein